MRADEMPRVLSPGIFMTLIRVTLDPTLLAIVSLGLSSSAALKKSSAFTREQLNKSSSTDKRRRNGLSLLEPADEITTGISY